MIGKKSIRCPLQEDVLSGKPAQRDGPGAHPDYRGRGQKWA